MCRLSAVLLHPAAILLFLVHTEHLTHGSPTGQYFLSTPHNTTVTAGHHARLACSVGNLAGTCQWTRDGMPLGRGRNLAGFSRYLLGGDREHVCDLTIEPVLPLDEGEYRCQVSGGDGVPAIASPPAALSVNSEPGQPYIVQAREEDMMEVQEGEEVELECQSQGGRPPAEIQWWDGEGRRIVSDVTEHVKRMEDRKTFKTVSTLKFTPDQPMRIKCSAHNDQFPDTKQSDGMEVVFKETMRMVTKTLKEEESFEVKCEDNDSEKLRYKWLINEKEILSESKNILKIEHFVKAHDKSIIKCFVEDDEGQRKVLKIVQLQLGYLDDTKGQHALARSQEETKITESRKKKGTHTGINKKTVFTCVAEGETSVEPKYVWISGKLEKTVEALDDGDKKFKCKVVEGGYDKIKQMGNKMQGISKTLRKFRKQLNKMVNSYGD
eukprot:GFUD01006704.1.p1 GENE.GFUD01006704.1~~GFUD01006704.1.p1  ORF type:complete len:471 (+),score=143.04 GFUD01006704.1:104-1414(+)